MDEIMEENKWWLIIDYDTTKRIIRADLANMQRSFIDIGCQLMQARDRELYKDGGYDSVWAFAEQEFGIQRSTASRWMKMCQKFSVDGSSPVLKDEYKDFGKSQLQEMLYLEDEQLEEVTPGMTVKEIRELRKPEKVEGDPVSILGHPLRIYPEGSLIATPGCGKQDCFSCHRGGCELRQVDCYCVEAPMGNPFPCTTLNVVESLRQDIGSKCQFVNEDLAFHRVGDGQPVPCCKKCDHPCGYECNRSVRARHEAAKKNMCDVAHESEEQITGQMSVEDYPELLPDQNKTDIDINNVEDNDVIKQPENVINPPESVTEYDEDVIDTEYKEIAAENTEADEICCQEAADLDELTFSQIAIRDYLKEEEQTLAEYEKVNSEDGGLPLNLMMRQRMLVKALRLLLESEAELEEDDELEELFLKGKEFMSCARNSLSNLNCEIEHKAWKAALASSGHLNHYLELVVSENTVQPELPVLKNNDQRKEWLNNYKDWGLWYRDEHIDVNYYKYDFSDGSRLVVAEYPRRRMYWKSNEFEDEHHYHLLDKHRKFYGTDKTFEQQFVHSTDSETSLIEFLKNLQKGEKK